ncbi:MAG TPA: TRAP transporter fused permease subunit [Longimicrobiales bacterium]
MGRAVLVISASAALFHLWAAGFAPFTALVQRPVHLAFMAALGFLGVGVQTAHHARGGVVESPGVAVRLRRGVDGALLAAALFTCVYIVTQHQELVRRAGSPTTLDLVAGVLAVVVVLELARRTTGWGLVTVAVLSLAYAFLGPWLPGFLAHRGYGFGRLAEHLYLSTEGIWGVPLGVSADFVYLFVLFGAVLDVAGGGALLIGLADRVAGRTAGGPAKTAAVASALMGSLSGSAVANVVTTGTFTIPLMKRAGFRPHFAGAIEAAASTGGQLMPPVMGAGAFILATWTGIPYARVAMAALIPALLYYAALLMAIHFRAGLMGLEGTAPGEREAVAPRVHLLIPLVVVVALLAMGRSPMRAAFWGVVSGLGAAALRSATRPTRSDLARALRAGAGGTVQVAAACAAAGVVVGVASLTGVGLRMSELIIAASGGSLALALVLTAAGSVILGMGLPTTAAYVVLAALGAPALVDLGVPVLAAHLFIFYFGCISNVTPPVSLAAYAAAGIAGAPAVRTALTGMGLASAGFLVPFAFVYGPGLLLEGGAMAVALTSLTALAGVTALAGAVVGAFPRRVSGWERAVLGAAAVALIFPGRWTDGFGLVAMGVVGWRYSAFTGRTSGDR